MSVYTFSNINLEDKISDQEGYLTDSYKNFFRSIKGNLDKNFNANGLHFPDINSNELSTNSTRDNGTVYYSNDNSRAEIIEDGERKYFNTTSITNPPPAPVSIKIPIIDFVSSIASPVLGEIVFDESLDKLQIFKSTGWSDT